MHWGSYSRLAWPKAVTLLAASHPIVKTGVHRHRRWRERQFRVIERGRSSLVDISALLQPALQTRERVRKREHCGSLVWRPTFRHSIGRLCFPEQRNPETSAAGLNRCHPPILLLWRQAAADTLSRLESEYFWPFPLFPPITDHPVKCWDRLFLCSRAHLLWLSF